MKKFIKLLLCTIIFFCLNGCDSKNVEKSNQLDIPVKYFKLVKFDCPEIMNNLKNVKRMNINFAVMNDNVIYELSFNKKFSNEQNCKLFNKEGYQLVDLGLYLGAFVDNDGYYYAYGAENDYKLLKSNAKDTVYSIRKTYGENLPVNMLYNSDELFTTIDNKVFLLNHMKYNAYEEGYELSNTPFFTLDNDEIISSYMNGFTTNKAFYQYTKVNKKECDKYADVKCEYGFIKDKELTKNYNKIKFYNYIILIDDKGHLYKRWKNENGDIF
jgi:hypothetical protein